MKKPESEEVPVTVNTILPTRAVRLQSSMGARELLSSVVQASVNAMPESEIAALVGSDVEVQVVLRAKAE